jgi:ADP-heptose:LPS heptosyltransferase
MNPAPDNRPETRILVIKLGALGDFVQAMGPFAAIRRHHADAWITLLTTQPYAELAQASDYFDEIWIDPRSRLPRRLLALRRWMRRARFARVYDLQTSDRTSFYYQMLWPGPYPEWSGIAKGCSHPHANPGRDAMHTLDRQAEQLRMAGLAEVPPPDLSWAEADVGKFGLDGRYAMLVPGGARHRPAKRWAVERYIELAHWLDRQGITPVLIGAKAEAGVLKAIANACPAARSLAGQTTFLDIVVLARGAVSAIGNDTGPMHLTAVAGCPSVILFSAESNPDLCAPKGARVVVVRRPSLADLSSADVEKVLAAMWQEKSVS